MENPESIEIFHIDGLPWPRPIDVNWFHLTFNYVVKLWGDVKVQTGTRFFWVDLNSPHWLNTIAIINVFFIFEQLHGLNIWLNHNHGI